MSPTSWDVLSLAGSGTNQQSMLRRLYNAVSVFDFISCLRYRSRESVYIDILFTVQPRTSNGTFKIIMFNFYAISKYVCWV